MWWKSTLTVLSLSLLGCPSVQTATTPVPATSAPAPHAPAGKAAEGRSAVVASAHPIATEAGRAVLADGGNAVDAAVAISLALSVVEPWSSGIGGGAFMVVHVGGTTTTWDMREMAPAAATRDMYVRDGSVIKGASTKGALSAGIPGLVRGLAGVHAKSGKLPWARLVQPAIVAARDGFILGKRFSKAMTQVGPTMNPAALAIFSRADGTPLQKGDRLIQRDLADTLEAISASNGEDFYTGKVAAKLVAAVRAEGGLWTEDDLTGYRAVARAPVVGTYRGFGVASMGPPSSGGLLLVQMLRVLEAFDLRGMGPADPSLQHVLAEVMKRAFAMRAIGLGDPDFAPVDHALFMAPSVVQRLVGEVRGASVATPAKDLARLEVKPKERTDTSHFAVMTADGDAVACTQTINLWFGSAAVAAGTGVVLNDEMDDFSAMPGAPNAFGLVGSEANSIAPGKRPLSSMTPTLVLRDGKVVGAFGSPGGSRIITTTLQSILNVVDHQMDVAAAISAPRIHHQWYPDELRYEDENMPAATREYLRGLGHVLTSKDPMGNAMGLWVRPDGVITGAADARGEGTAAGL